MTERKKKEKPSQLFPIGEQDSSSLINTPNELPQQSNQGATQESTCCIQRPIKTFKNQQTEASSEKDQIIRAFDLVHSPASLSFRQKESQQISSFIQEALKDGLKCRCLLLTGMPGAGKTSLAKRMLQRAVGIRCIFMNANILLTDFVMEFSYQLVGSKLRLHQLIPYLQKRKAYQKVFVLIDEFDSLFKNATAESLDIFRIFSPPIQNVSLIATSNSMQIMHNLSSKYNLTLPSFKNVVFTQYGIEQIKSIILERVDYLKKTLDYKIEFEELALKYCATKIYNFKGGDIRFALEQVKLIITKCLEANTEKRKCKVTFESACLILTKLNKANERTDIMKSLPFQQALTLIGLYKLFWENQRLQVSTLELEKEIKQIQNILHLDKQVNHLMDILRYLEVYQFVGMREKKKLTYVNLKASVATIKNAYEDDLLLGRYFWE